MFLSPPGNQDLIQFHQSVSPFKLVYLVGLGSSEYVSCELPYIEVRPNRDADSGSPTPGNYCFLMPFPG